MFSLVTGLPSTTSAAGISTDLVRRLRGYYADVRLLAGVHARVTLLAFRADPAVAPDASEVSRFSRVQFLDVRTAHGLRWACPGLAISSAAMLHSR